MLRTRKGYAVEITTDLVGACRQANQQYAAGRLRAFLAAGGDGTISEVANRTDPGVPLAFFPAGTSNLVARHLRLRASPDLLYETIAAGKLKRLDAGRASGRLFVAMASCGFDAEVVRQVHSHRQGGRRGSLGYWGYVKPILGCIRSYEYPEMRVYCDGSCEGPAVDPTEAIRARWVFSMNLPKYGWGLPLAPWASQTDGLLDLCTLGHGSLPMGLYYVAVIHLGIHRQLADCTTRRVRRLRITAEAEVRYQLDGDPAGVLPVDIEVLPGRLSVLVPPGRSASPR